MRPEHDQPRPRAPADRTVAGDLLETDPRPATGARLAVAARPPSSRPLAVRRRARRGAPPLLPRPLVAVRAELRLRRGRRFATECGRCGIPRATPASRCCWPTRWTSRCSCSRGAGAARRGRRAAPAARPRRRQPAGAPPRDGALGGVGGGRGLRPGRVRALHRQPGAALSGGGVGAVGPRRAARGGAPAGRPAHRDPRDARRACRRARWARRSCSRPPSSASCSWTIGPWRATAAGCASSAPERSSSPSPRPLSWGPGLSSRAPGEPAGSRLGRRSPSRSTRWCSARASCRSSSASPTPSPTPTTGGGRTSPTASPTCSPSTSACRRCSSRLRPRAPSPVVDGRPRPAALARVPRSARAHSGRLDACPSAARRSCSS